MKKLNRVGEKYMTNEGYTVEIVEYNRDSDIAVRFESGVTLYNRCFGDVKKGNVKNPYHPLVFGVGYLGIGDYKSKINKKHTREYITWSSMLQRCYYKNQQQSNYVGCEVSEVWHNFQIFAKWHEENHVDGFALDKDILVKGNKTYSPGTCVFVPAEINNLFIKSNSIRGPLPIGVSAYRNGFIAQMKYKGKRIHLGVFDTIEEAFACYKNAKEAYIKELADKWHSKIDYRLYIAMYEYQVEITD